MTAPSPIESPASLSRYARLERFLQQDPANLLLLADAAEAALAEGLHAACARLLEPWLDDDAATRDHGPALHALWLRAMHQLDALNDAWAWIERREAAGTLSALAAGVASLVAVDLSHMDRAQQLAQRAIDANPAQPEPLVALASVALTRREGAAARSLLQSALKIAPHDPRAWTSLGFAELLDQQFGAAREAFQTACRLAPERVENWQGLGWACAMLHDPSAAAAAFATGDNTSHG